ncbi:L,D-transpeptidase family protein [Algicella marina]|uniref:L,D-transpeptidase family protein n=1 Tax=Algicella marina TaxID=2683284 RepID=A0A6P1T5K0_9RHOB|nr:L,D-transpeptidase family protein [Algicella marina]QHQ36569.1 L,D-transpeptidase family protein [Algicella marina]
MTHVLTKRGLLVGAAALTVSACSQDISRLATADAVVVSKSKRELYVVSGGKSVKSYRVNLGFSPQGHKEKEGDGRTPEGFYFIDRKNPQSDFHLSLGINYPNATDVARAEAMGVKPGGDIFIHGGPRPKIDKGGPDWTAGCIAVSDREIEEIYAMVRMGTPVQILT